MGLDIYAGTLTRYYARNWETAVQQWAKKNGYKVKLVSSSGAEVSEEPMDPVAVQQVVESWRDFVLNAVRQEGQESYLPWVEDNEKPYYTDKPDWEAWAALKLYAACKLYGEAVPAVFKKHGTFEDYDIAARIADDPNANWSLFLGAVLWLPLKETLAFRGPMPANNTEMIASTGLLCAELNAINHLGWQAEEEEICRWSSTEGYPADAVVKPDGTVFTKEDFAPNTEYDTESLAKFAYSMLWQAVRFSEEHNVPILLDY